MIESQIPQKVADPPKMPLRVPYVVIVQQVPVDS